MRPNWRMLRSWYEAHIPTPALGLAIGVALFMGVRVVSPHPGEACGNLGRTTEEWEIGMPATPLMCAATVDGDLVYERMIVPPPKARNR
jgi:hypothetical protein